MHRLQETGIQCQKWNLALIVNNVAKINGILQFHCEVCSSQIRSVQIRSVQIRSVQIRSVQIRSVQIRSVQIRSVQIRSVQIRSVQIRSVQIRSVQIRSVQIRSVQIRSVQIRSVQIRSVQIRSVQIRSVQIRSVQIRSGTLFGIIDPESMIVENLLELFCGDVHRHTIPLSSSTLHGPSLHLRSGQATRCRSLPGPKVDG